MDAFFRDLVVSDGYGIKKRYGSELPEYLESIAGLLCKSLLHNGATAIHVPGYVDGMQAWYIKAVLDKCQTTMETDDYSQFCTRYKGEPFFQVIVLIEESQIKSFLVGMTEFVVAICQSLTVQAHLCDKVWQVWRSDVKNWTNMPEFLFNLIIQISHDTIMELFPNLSQTYMRCGDSSYDTVYPRPSVQRAVRALANNVPLMNWAFTKSMDEYLKSESGGKGSCSLLENKIKTRSPVLVSRAVSAAAASSPDMRHAQELSRYMLLLSPSKYKDLNEDVLVTLKCLTIAFCMNGQINTVVYKSQKLHCPDGFTDAPHRIHFAVSALRANVIENHIPGEVLQVCTSLVDSYSDMPKLLPRLEPFTRVSVCFCPVVPANPNDIRLIISQARGVDPASIFIDPTKDAFFYIQGRVLGLEYENTYMNPENEGICGLILFLRAMGIPKFDAHSKRDYSWEQLDCGLVIKMPRVVASSLLSGGTLFASFVFPTPRRLGHLLLRYFTLYRMFFLSESQDEFWWVVRILIFKLTDDLDVAMKHNIPFIQFQTDMTTEDQIRRYVRSLLSIPTLDMNIQEHFKLVMRVIVSLCSAHCAQTGAIDVSIEALVQMDLLGVSITQVNLNEYYRILGMLLEQNAAEDCGLDVLDCLDKWCIVKSENCGPIYQGSPSLKYVKESVLHYSVVSCPSQLPQDCTSSLQSEIANSQLPVESGIRFFMQFEALVTDIDYLDIFNHFQTHIGNAHRNFKDIRMPLFYAYNSMTSCTSDSDCIPLARIGDLLDPLDRLKDVMAYYRSDGHTHYQMHPSSLYGSNPAIVSDILSHRELSVSPHSPIKMSTQKKWHF